MTIKRISPASVLIGILGSLSKNPVRQWGQLLFSLVKGLSHWEMHLDPTRWPAGQGSRTGCSSGCGVKNETRQIMQGSVFLASSLMLTGRRLCKNSSDVGRGQSGSAGAPSGKVVKSRTVSSSSVEAPAAVSWMDDIASFLGWFWSFRYSIILSEYVNFLLKILEGKWKFGGKRSHKCYTSAQTAKYPTASPEQWSRAVSYWPRDLSEYGTWEEKVESIFYFVTVGCVLIGAEVVPAMLIKAYEFPLESLGMFTFAWLDIAFDP